MSPEVAVAVERYHEQQREHYQKGTAGLREVTAILGLDSEGPLSDQTLHPLSAANSAEQAGALIAAYGHLVAANTVPEATLKELADLALVLHATASSGQLDAKFGARLGAVRQAIEECSPDFLMR